MQEINSGESSMWSPNKLLLTNTMIMIEVMNKNVPLTDLLMLYTLYKRDCGSMIKTVMDKITIRILSFGASMCRKTFPLKRYLIIWSVLGKVWAQMQLKNDWICLVSINLRRRRLKSSFLHLLFRILFLLCSLNSTSTALAYSGK